MVWGRCTVWLSRWGQTAGDGLLNRMLVDLYKSNIYCLLIEKNEYFNDILFEV